MSFWNEALTVFRERLPWSAKKKRLTYAEIEVLSNRMAHALIEQGIGKQDRVAVFLDNSVESILSIFATLKLGGVFVVINPLIKKNKLQYILNDCDAGVLVTDSRKLRTVKDALSQCRSLRSVFITDPVETSEAGPEGMTFLPMPDILQKQNPDRPKPDIIDIDLASLIYTSGSTGIPKGVMMTHLNMVSAADSIITYLENQENDIILSVLPLAFDYGLYQVLMAFRFGGTVILEKSFTYPFQVIDLLIKEKATGFPLVPTIAAILLKMSDLKKYDFSHLRYITNTAQALPAQHIQRLQDIFPFTDIYSMYGLTECKRVSYLPPAELKKRPGSVGIPMPNTEAYIVSETGERILQPDRIGELVVRGSHVMKGYWNLKDETEAVLKPGEIPGEKVLYTGDLFKQDDEGYLYFVSRNDDMLKVSGERVSPKEVESVLHALEGINEAAVIGVPDEILGQAVMAFVTLKRKNALSVDDIIKYCSQNMESFMVPRHVVILEDLPRTSNGKIDKLVLAETALSIPEAKSK